MIRTIKTKQFKITALVLALVLTVSCVMWNTTKVHAQELEINNTNVQTFAGSRAIENGKLVGAADAPAEIGIFITDGSADKYNATNVKWTHDGTSWTADSSILFEGADSNQKISAYYPYTETTNGSIAITLPEAYDANYDQYDYLYGEYHPLSSNPATIRMEHLMAKVTVNVQDWGTELAGDDVKSIAIASGI